MHVLVYAPFSLWTPHCETDLEIIERHLEQGDTVSVLGCDGEFPSCVLNPKHCPGFCLKCRTRREEGLKLLSAPVAYTSLAQWLPPERKELAELLHVAATMETVEELKAWRWQEFDLGYSVLSSLVSIQRNPALRLDEHRPLVLRLVETAWMGYRAVGNFLSAQPVQRVYVFNGRFAGVRGCLRACQQQGVDCWTHERGHDTQHYELYRNALPHDIAYVEAEIRSAWQAADPEQRATRARQWYEDRARGIDHRWHSFVQDQRVDCLPDPWPRDRRNIALFVSSEDEFVGVGDQWTNTIYRDQIEGLQRVVDSLETHASRAHLFVRVHPNLKGVDNTQTRHLASVVRPWVTVIPADSPISTYALMRAADVTLSFGSTAGIEACYWRRPSILAGRSFYAELGGTYNPNSHAELIQDLLQRVEPRPLEPALMYGYYQATYGHPYRYFRPDGIHAGTFKGARLRLPFARRMQARYLKIRARMLGLP